LAKKQNGPLSRLEKADRLLLRKLVLLAGVGGNRFHGLRFLHMMLFIQLLNRSRFGSGGRSGVLSLRGRQHRNGGQQGNSDQLFHFLSPLFCGGSHCPPTILLCLIMRSRAITSIGDFRLRKLMNETSSAFNTGTAAAFPSF
jgi:hypothetical protein